MADDSIELAKWSSAFINDLPNSSFAAIEPDYLSGKTKDKNARHLPFKDGSGKVDLPHLGNALSRMNQVIPVTKSISTEALRAKAKATLIPYAKKHLPDSQWAKQGEFDRIDLSMDRPVKVELITDGIDPAADTYKLKIELIDDDTYNGLYWAPEQLASMVQEFKKGDRHISHGLDHSHKTLEQLGHVYDMEMIKDAGKTRVNVFSENFKETAVQKEALILFKQGLLNYISGGWKGKITFNEDKGRFEIMSPVLLEISSTPVPAKKDAKVKEILNSLQAPFSLDEDSEENNMPDETQEQTPPPQGESGAEKERLTLLEAEVKTLKEKTLEQAKRVEAAERTALIAKGVELGLAVEDFKEMSNAEIQSSLSIANKAIVVALRGIDPTTGLGAGESSMEKDGTPEMAAKLLKTYAPHLSHGEVPKKDGE